MLSDSYLALWINILGTEDNPFKYKNLYSFKNILVRISVGIYPYDIIK